MPVNGKTGVLDDARFAYPSAVASNTRPVLARRRSSPGVEETGHEPREREADHGRKAGRQEDRVPRRQRGRRAGRAHRALEGGRGGGRAARAGLAPTPARSRPSTTSTRRDTFAVDRRWRTPTRPTTTGSCCPGGVANPDFLRTDEDAVAFVRGFFEQAKPVGVICHGAVDAGRGRRGARAARSRRGRRADRHPQRRRQLGRRGGRRRRGPRDLAQARTTCRRSAPRSSRSSRGRARGAGPQRGA